MPETTSCKSNAPILGILFGIFLKALLLIIQIRFYNYFKTFRNMHGIKNGIHINTSWCLVYTLPWGEQSSR